jgi:hypothetical protein
VTGLAHHPLVGAHEAVDVAIPPVLSEAALALANEDLPTVLARAASSASLAGIHSAGPSPSHSDTFGPLFLPPSAHQAGWQSPSLTYALERAEHPGSPGSSSAALDSPPPGAFDRVPTNATGSPATSPEPPLLEAKLAAAYVSEPPLSASPLSSAPNSPRSLSPAPMLTVKPFPKSSMLSSSPEQPLRQASEGSSGRDRRRLSFLSYADLISASMPSLRSASVSSARTDIERGNPPADQTWDTSALAASLQDDSGLPSLSELGSRAADRDKDEDTLTMRPTARRVPPALELERE